MQGYAINIINFFVITIFINTVLFSPQDLLLCHPKKVWLNTLIAYLYSQLLPTLRILFFISKTPLYTLMSYSEGLILSFGYRSRG